MKFIVTVVVVFVVSLLTPFTAVSGFHLMGFNFGKNEVCLLKTEAKIKLEQEAKDPCPLVNYGLHLSLSDAEVWKRAEVFETEKQYCQAAQMYQEYIIRTPIDFVEQKIAPKKYYQAQVNQFYSLVHGDMLLKAAKVAKTILKENPKAREEVQTYLDISIAPVLDQYTQKIERLELEKEYCEAARLIDDFNALVGLPMFESWKKRQAEFLLLGEHYNDARTTAREFLAFYPKSEAEIEMMYVVAQAYFEQIPEKTDFQAKAAKQAQRAFLSIRKKDKYFAREHAALEKIKKAYNWLAAKEMQIAKYYLNHVRKENLLGPFKYGDPEYVAAAGRFETVVLKYPKSDYVQEALYNLAKIYEKLGQLDEAKFAADLLRK